MTAPESTSNKPPVPGTWLAVKIHGPEDKPRIHTIALVWPTMANELPGLPVFATYTSLGWIIDKTPAAISAWAHPPVQQNQVEILKGEIRVFDSCLECPVEQVVRPKKEPTAPAISHLVTIKYEDHEEVHPFAAEEIAREFYNSMLEQELDVNLCKVLDSSHEKG